MSGREPSRPARRAEPPRLKVLVSALSCSPGAGSEPGFGWGLVSELARHADVWVLTDEHMREAISRVEDGSTVPSLHVVYTRAPRFLDPIFPEPPLHYVYYFVWQLKAFREARRLHREIGFDIVQHLTFASSWAPTLMGWVGAPFVWTAGKREDTPFAFLSQMTWRQASFEVLRSAGSRVLRALSDFLVARRAAVILSASPRNRWSEHLPVREFAVGALAASEVGEPNTIDMHTRSLRIASVGRLIGSKGVSMSIEAFARVQRVFPNCEYWIVGDGPERRRLNNLVQALGCGSSIRFLGRLPRNDVLDLLRQVDVLVHPSLHETCPTVLMEAMAAQCVAICLDAGGSPQVVGDAGIVLRRLSPGQVVADLEAALLELVQNPRKREHLRRVGRQRVEDYWTWPRVVKRLLAVFDDVLVQADTPSTARVVPTLEFRQG